MRAVAVGRACHLDREETDVELNERIGLFQKHVQDCFQGKSFGGCCLGALVDY